MISVEQARKNQRRRDILRDHGRGRHNTIPLHECPACARFDVRINPDVGSPEWTHREGFHTEIGYSDSSCSLCATPRANPDREEADDAA